MELSRGITAKDAIPLGAIAQLGESFNDFRIGDRTFDIEIKVVMPGTALDRAALDLQKADAAPGENAERGIERAGLMLYAYDELNFVLGVFCLRLS